MTREQYVNTASDLVGFDVRPLVRFADAGGRGGIGVSLSALELEQRMATAEAIAAAAVEPAHLAALLPCPPAGLTDACAAQLIERLGLRAFRRPLTAETTRGLRALFDAGKAAGGAVTGVQWLLSGILQSPDFLYQLAPRPEASTGAVALDDYSVASRLSFFLWGGGPDAALLTAAGKNALRTPAAIEAQARRMLGDPRAARMREDYYGGWLKLDGLATATRDAKEFTPELAATLLRSLLEGIHDLHRNGAKVETLLSSSSLFADAPMAKLYGLPPPAGTGLAPVAAPAAQRRGLVTHPALLALLASADASDPIKRGVFFTEALLCQTLPDPAASIPDLPPPRMGLSTRQRLEQHRSAPACASCHALFDPIGLALENYDSIGRHRQSDQGVTVDSSSEVKLDSDLDGTYQDGMALLARMATSTTVRDCMVSHWLQYALRRDLVGGERCAVDAIKERFRMRGDLEDLLVAIATSGLFNTVLADTGAMP